MESIGLRNQGAERMTDQSRIDKGLYWDRAWTLTRGCTPAGAGCANCWSAAQSHIRSKQKNPPECYKGVTTDDGKWNGVVEPMEANLELPLRVRKPTTWAVWNDLFHEDIPSHFIVDAFGVMAALSTWGRQQTFIILTKRPSNMRDLLTTSAFRHDVAATAANLTDEKNCDNVFDGIMGEWWPLPNVITGYSASNQDDLGAGIRDLLKTPAAVRLISYEPALSPLSFDGLRRCSCGEFVSALINACPHCGNLGLRRIDWVIVGAESGPKHRECDHGWVESITGQCESAGVPCFVKQEWIDGKLVKMPVVRGLIWDQFPEEPSR